MKLPFIIARKIGVLCPQCGASLWLALGHHCGNLQCEWKTCLPANGGCGATFDIWTANGRWFINPTDKEEMEGRDGRQAA